MGLMSNILSALFGSGRNAVVETAQVFRANAENSAVRESAQNLAVVDQFAAEFYQTNRGGFDRFMDGINRMPRPIMALGSMLLIVAAMVDPVWFTARMVGLTAVPEPLWWLMGIVISFYFGGRYQATHQDFQKSVATTVARIPEVVKTIEELRTVREVAAVENMPELPTENPALADWRRGRS